MNAKRKIEVFTAGCPACEETVELVNRIACPSCEVSVLDMHDTQVAERAKYTSIQRHHRFPRQRSQGVENPNSQEVAADGHASPL